MSSPTQRSLALLREQGYLAQVVEHYNPHVKRRYDLYGFLDILAVRRDEILGVQTTTSGCMAARVRKIADHPNIGAVRESGMTIHVHGWRKYKKPVKGKWWRCRIVDVS